MGTKAERERSSTKEGLFHAGSSGELNGDSLDPEALDPASVEVRFGNPEVDAPRLLELFTQPTTIAHLADIVPYSYIDETKDPDTGAVIQRREIPATTVDYIRKIYEDPSLTLLTAETPSGIIIGTYTAERPGRGSRAGGGGLLAVHEDYRRQGVATRLIKAGNALMCREGDGGFDCNLVDVYVIMGVSSYSNALDAFGKEGFEIKEQRPGGTQSWSHELGKLVDRVSIHMTLERGQYIRDFPGDHIEYFPTPRPPRAA